MHRTRSRWIGEAKTGLLPVTLVVLLLSGCGNPARIHVPPPTGDRTNDLAVVAEAFDRAEPGETIAFAPGTYLVGSEGLVLRTPGMTLLGHPDGTTLLGCTVEERADPGMGYYGDVDPEMGYFWEVCDGLILAAEAQRVSGLRFEGVSAALAIKDPSAQGEPPASAGADRATAFTGGHVIEGNTFQDVVTFSIKLDAESAVTIRGNVFRNTHHAVAMGGRNIRVLENDISAPDPDRIPDSYPGVAIGIRPGDDGTCGSMLVEGTSKATRRASPWPSSPRTVPGAVCSDITIRANEIVSGPVPWPADSDRAGRLAVAPAIRLLNAQRAVGEGAMEWSERFMPEGGWPAELSESRISNIRLERNRVVGAVGVAIELLYASDNHIVDNEIEVRPAVTPEELDGLELGGNGGPGGWVRMGLLDQVNGTPVWLSPGSEGNLVRNPQ